METAKYLPVGENFMLWTAFLNFILCRHTFRTVFTSMQWLVESTVRRRGEVGEWDVCFMEVRASIGRVVMEGVRRSSFVILGDE